MVTVRGALLDPSGLTPHGFCLLWEPGLLWLHAASDALIGIAYYSIPLALIYFVRRRTDLVFGWVFWLFAAFILACGTTHFLSIVTLWQPAYWLEGAVKAFTAILSVGTAVALWPLLPRALAIPSPQALRDVNEELARRIADRDKAETALRASEARLLQARKMETIGQLTGGVAHDFNNLLTVMLGSLETMDRKLGRLPPTVEVQSIRKTGDIGLRAVESATKLTRSLLAFARRQPLTPRPLDVNRLVSDLSDLLRRTLGETIGLETTLAGGLWVTRTDSNQLENALLNLAVNARDAMPDGGRLTIETGNAVLNENDVRDLDEPVAAGQYVVVAVSDTGFGMDVATMERAFEPFFTTKEAGHGSGLGLSQVYGFVRQSQGIVRLDSAPGKGTTVRLYLPRLIEPPSSEPPSGEPARAEPDLAPPRPAERGGPEEIVLVVEDDDSLRPHGAATLRELGYSVLEAANGQGALDIVDAEPRIDLLFTDIVLPGGMNGRQLAAEAVRRRPGLKVLLTSGYARDAKVHDGGAGQGAAFIAKPFRYAELAAKIRHVLAGEQPDDA
jgi:signal transduction histidine kinase/ActR/RegA family two-component response regulator